MKKILFCILIIILLSGLYFQYCIINDYKEREVNHQENEDVLYSMYYQCLNRENSQNNKEIIIEEDKDSIKITL